MLLLLQQNNLLAEEVDPGEDLSLSLDAGSVTIAGQSVSFGIDTAVTTGALTVAGQTLTLGISVPLTAGAIGIAGESLDLEAQTDIALSLDAGSVLIQGGSVEFALSGASTGAGRSKRKRRYFVEIDGQEFEVSSPSEATALLERAKTVAETVLEKARAAPVRVNRGLQRPRITTNDPELKQVVAKARQEIASLYDDALRDLEIRALMRKRDEEEEEAILRLLM